MDGEGCWSTVVSSTEERQALGLPASAGWMLGCRLGIGHRGNHATDASSHPRSDRRYWLEWNDFDPQAQSLIQRNPCPIPSPENAPCVFFHGHGGPHFYARSNGHAPSAMSGMAASGGRRAPAPGPNSAQPHRDARGAITPAPGTGQRPASGGPSTGDLPVSTMNGAHRMPDHMLAEQPPQVVAPATPAESQGGRRSSGVEPAMAADPYHGRRHRLDDRAEPVPGTPPAGVPPTGVPPTGAPAAGVRAGQGPQMASHPLDSDSVGAALHEVAVALSKLADALRRD